MKQYCNILKHYDVVNNQKPKSTGEVFVKRILEKNSLQLQLKDLSALQGSALSPQPVTQMMNQMPNHFSSQPHNSGSISSHGINLLIFSLQCSFSVLNHSMSHVIINFYRNRMI